MTSVWQMERACSSVEEQVLNADGKTWCGGQDSNLRTNKEWDLNPPPLTKLGDPRASWGRRLLDLKQAIHWDAEKPAFSITVMTSCTEMFSLVVMVPLSVECDTSAASTSG